MTTTQRPVRPPRKYARFRHPSAAAYIAGCPCQPCMDLRYRQTKDYRRRVAADGLALIDANPVQDHLRELLEDGYSPTAIAATAQVDRSTVTNIAGGQHPTTSRQAAVRILATTGNIILERAPDKVRVPSLGAHRRIRALQTLGWTVTMIAETAKLAPRAIEWAARYPQRTIPAQIHRAIAAVYDQLSMQIGPSKRTADWAKREGCTPPLAWNDDDIDSPNGQPQQPPDTAPNDERNQHIIEMTTHGRSARDIAEKLGCSTRTVVRVRNKVIVAAA